MLGLDSKTARASWTVTVVFGALWIAYSVRHTLFLFTVALFFAYTLTPILAFARRVIPRRVSDNVILIAVYLAFTAGFVAAAIGVGSIIVEQASALVARLPELIKQRDPLESIPLPGWLDPLRAKIVEALRGYVENLNHEAFPLIRAALTQVLPRFGGLLQFILVPVLAFFMLKDAAEIRETLLRWTSGARASELLERILADVHVLLGSYIRAVLTLAVAVLLVYTAFLQFTGAPYALLLGTIAAVLEVIPVAGPLTAGVVVVIVASVLGYPHVLLLISFLLAYRVFQDYVLAPYLMGTGVELHPLLVLFGVLAGEQVAGIPGMFLSVPVIAALRVVYIQARRQLLPGGAVVGNT